MTHKKRLATAKIGGKTKGRRKGKDPCSVPACGRPFYARNLCQTHHRQKHMDGQVRPIRPYRKRTSGTVKFAGLRLSASCARTLQRYADDRGLSLGAAIADVLEESVRTKKGGRSS